LQLFVSCFLMLYSHQVTIKKMLPTIIVGFIGLSMIGSFRAQLSLNIDSIKIVISNISEKKFTSDTAYAAYYSSLTFLKVEDFITRSMRIDMFKKFLLSIILGGSKVENSSLPSFTRNYYMHYNGGILPIYFHFYLGWL